MYIVKYRKTIKSNVDNLSFTIINHKILLQNLLLLSIIHFHTYTFIYSTCYVKRKMLNGQEQNMQIYLKRKKEKYSFVIIEI